MSNFNSTRISSANIEKYLQEEANDKDSIRLVQKDFIRGVPALLQKDYGLPKDCTLTSITALTSFTLPDEDTHYIYNVVEEEGKKLGYNGDKYGTLWFTISHILRKVRKIFGINRKTSWRLLKGIGFNFNTLVNLTKEGKPVVLSMWRDGRKYYGCHSVLVYGYSVFKVDNRLRHFLVIQDNWYKTSSYLDYEKLSFISSIDY